MAKKIKCRAKVLDCHTVSRGGIRSMRILIVAPYKQSVANSLVDYLEAEVDCEFEPAQEEIVTQGTIGGPDIADPPESAH